MKIRIISAIVAIILAAVILIFHNTIIFNIAIALFTIAMLFEIFSALKCLQFKITSAICFVFAGAMPIFLYKNWYSYRYAFLVVCLIGIFMTYLIQYKSLPFEKLCIMITSSLLLTLSMNSMLQINNSSEKHGLFILILSLCGAWLADTGAYFAGTLFGKHKLCPDISPKKTVEGLIGGTITNGILFVLITFAYSYFQAKNDVFLDVNYYYIAVLGLICSLLGLLGDLSASLLKRQCQIKDYGNIMPGHGGVMDRFDSVLFVVPFMYLATTFIPIIK